MAAENATRDGQQFVGCGKVFQRDYIFLILEKKSNMENQPR